MGDPLLLTLRRFFSLASIASALLSATACGDSVAPIDVTGNYTLQAVNGSLPYRIHHVDESGETLFDVVSGTLALNANDTFSEVLTFHVIPPPPDVPGDTSVTTVGTYVVHGGDITFTTGHEPAPTYSWNGTVVAGNVTYVDPLFSDVPGGIIAVYVK